MKKLLPLLVVLLAGCTTTPVPVRLPFPSLPESLTTPCPELELVKEPTEKLSDVLTVVTDNYATYYTCKIKVDSWLEWYTTQKKISDGVK